MTVLTVLIQVTGLQRETVRENHYPTDSPQWRSKKQVRQENDEKSKRLFRKEKEIATVCLCLIQFKQFAIIVR